MGTALSTSFLTLADWAKRITPQGGIDSIIEILAESNPIIKDASVIEGNLPTGHRHTERTTLPAGTWRTINAGVAETKSTTEQKDDQCGMLEAFSAVDAALVELAGNAQAFRLSEDQGFIQGLSNDVEEAIVYANSKTDPEKLHGLAPRYNSLTGTPGSTQNITGGGSGSTNTSVWLVTWGPKLTTLMFPKGSQAGLQSEDLGRRPWDDSATNPYMAYVTHYVWKLGLVVHDYRYIVRICNVDVALLTSDASTGADLMDKMTDAYYARPSVSLGNMAQTFFYCNKTVAKFLHKQAQNKSNVNLSIDDPAGKPIVKFLDAPVHICDSITSIEATI